MVANEAAARIFGVPPGERRTDPAGRPPLGGTQVADFVVRAEELAHSAEGWCGTLTLPVPGTEEGIESTLYAVLSAGHPAGFLVTVGTAEGEVLDPAPDPAGRAYRVPAQRDARTLLLRPREIRLAEADGNEVWLDTDYGRLRAAERGMSRLEAGLREHGFERVHRRFLVNLARVVEVGRDRGGSLLLFLDAGGSTPVPVSRARAAVVRRLLGL